MHPSLDARLIFWCWKLIYRCFASMQDPLTWYNTPHPVHTPRKLENAVAKAVMDAIRFKHPHVQQPFQQKLDGLPNNAHLRRHPLPAAEVQWLEVCLSLT